MDKTKIEDRVIIAMSRHFPRIKPGHGSMRKGLLNEYDPVYRPMICNHPDCSPDNPKHRQSPLKAAERFLA
jgi:hypothetical protein